MEQKKSVRADLQNKRFLFGEIGLVVTLLIVWLTFEWSTKSVKAEEFGPREAEEELVEEIPVTRQPEIELPPPPPPQQTVAEVLDIVEDDVKVEDNFADQEVNENDSFEQQEIVPVDQPEEQEEESTPFVIVEDMPEFKGGDKALLKYIGEHVVYPEMAKENDIQGTVYVGFVVNEKGKVTNVTVLRGVDPLLDKEAIKVIQGLPDWKPGKQSGKNVKVRMQVPIKFQLAN